jgi:hypothetical protein
MFVSCSPRFNALFLVVSSPFPTAAAEPLEKQSDRRPYRPTNKLALCKNVAHRPFIGKGRALTDRIGFNLLFMRSLCENAIWKRRREWGFDSNRVIARSLLRAFSVESRPLVSGIRRPPAQNTILFSASLVYYSLGLGVHACHYILVANKDTIWDVSQLFNALSIRSSPKPDPISER